MLAQQEGLLAPEADTGGLVINPDLGTVSLPGTTSDDTSAGVWAAVSGSASQFLSDYQAWQAGGAAGLAQAAADLQSLRAQVGAQWDAARAAGNTAGAAALADTVAAVDAAQADVASAQAQADQWGGTWGTLAQWLSAIGAASGLGLVFIPLALSAAAAVAAIAALAYVLRTWRDNADRASFFRGVLDKLAAGQITEQQAKQLTDSYTPPSGSLFGGWLGGLGTAGLLAGAVVVVLALRR